MNIPLTKNQKIALDWIETEGKNVEEEDEAYVTTTREASQYIDKRYALNVPNAAEVFFKTFKNLSSRMVITIYTSGKSSSRIVSKTEAQQYWVVLKEAGFTRIDF